ncbi:TonB-dependent receptor [Marinoscillum pacificum]|uniref:TonB-dependent receptor n=1 Tax=Marinoscillum pacificum TaxID=392723 RepID=UPI0021588D77|nr:carboxypeptidase-like regulatory domain-containing protein [Marinoscillum pacificum]
MKYWIVILALISTVALKAQTLTGRVFDQLSNEPLVGATVGIARTNTGVITNANGRYTLNELEPGRVDLIVSYVGYQPVEINDVWIKTGKVTNQDIYLERSYDLEEVVVSAAKPYIQPGKITITEEQINRFAATYYDPARLITSSPDVAVANDQNNEISVRGLAPSYNVWKLEGVEIVNPNHLSNAGTFLDQPTATGGGVNMLSAQMLDQSEFLYSTFDNRNGNSVGGIFNMNLKKGTDQDRQYTAQASLIGLDFATEGPFRQGGKTTYAANYRYSFTGLLAGMGVDFGGESIGFQDLSFNVSTPLGERSELKVFGVGGLSYNDFTHKSFEESENAKDRKDIYYNNQTGIAGAALKVGRSSGQLDLSIAYSVADNERSQANYDNSDDKFYTNNVLNNRQVVSFNASNVQRISNGQIEVGVMQNFYTYEYQMTTTNILFNPSANYQQWLARPYARLEGQLSSKVSGYLGTSASFTNGDQVVDPRAGVTVGIGKTQSITLSGGMYSQLLNPYNYNFGAAYGELYLSDDPEDYSFMSSYRGTVSHDVSSRDFTVHTEVFYYYFPDVNYSGSDEKETATTGGMSVVMTKDFSNTAYMNVGASIYDSEIDVYESYFNTGYSATVSAGKEWDLTSGSKNRRLSVDLRGMYQGGYRPYNGPIGDPGGRFLLVQRPEDYYQQRDYLRFDLRVVWKRYHENRTTSIALDLQNVANIENFAYQYYDSFTRQWEVQNQLGLIPILAYRVEW